MASAQPVVSAQMHRVSAGASGPLIRTATFFHRASQAFVSVLLAAFVGLVLTWAGQAKAAPAAPTNWVEVYDPSTVRSLNVRLSEADWLVIRSDETFDIEVPGLFWADDEPASGVPIVIRRKSASAIGDKVSYRIKFKSTWNGLKSLSLENGDDQDVVREGLSWQLHVLAATRAEHLPSLAAWANLALHLTGTDASGNPTERLSPQGIYVNVELPDRRFLERRGLWDAGATWLYKQDDIGAPELKEWPGGDAEVAYPSPAVQGLNYSPFAAEVVQRKRVLNPTPDDTTLEGDLERWVHMDTLLTLGAVNAFTDNPDELFNKGKNFFWADFDVGSEDSRRVYFPWDLDAAVRSTTAGIYGSLSTRRGKVSVSQHPYQAVILNHPRYREEYNAVLTQLLNGSLSEANLVGLVGHLEAVLTAHLLADPASKVGGSAAEVAGYFSSLEAWLLARRTNVLGQVGQNGPPAPR